MIVGPLFLACTSSPGESPADPDDDTPSGPTDPGDPGDPGDPPDPTGTLGTGGDAVPSPGCGASSVPAGAYEQTLVSGGVERHYLVEVPPAHDGVTPLPLVLDLHGTLGTDSQQRALSKLDDAAREDGFVGVWPDSLSPGGLKAWLLTCNGDDVAFVDALLDALGETLCLDESRFVATGLSNGAYFTNILGAVRPERFAALAPVAGGPGVTGILCRPNVALPVTLVHGTEDEIVPYDEGQAARDLWVETDGCTGSTVDADGCQMATGCAPGTAVRFCTAEGVGHLLIYTQYPSTDRVREMVAAIPALTDVPTDDDFPRVAEYWPAEERKKPGHALRPILTAVAEATGLSVEGPLYPNERGLRTAAARALERAVHAAFRFRLTAVDPSPALLQDLCADHLGSRPGPHRRTKVPDAPLLFYALGSWYAEWLTRHTFAHWIAEEVPVQPLQDGFDFTEVDLGGPYAVCAYPFVHVCKVFADPKGDAILPKATYKREDVRLLLPSPYVEIDYDGAIVERATSGGRRAEARRRQHGRLPLARDEAATDPLALDLALGTALRERDHTSALALADRAARATPYAARLLRLADVKARAKRPIVEILADVDLALDQSPRFEEALLRRAWCLATLGRAAEAHARLVELRGLSRDPHVLERVDAFFEELRTP